MDKKPMVYIMTNKRNGTLYTGVTSNLPRRIGQHKEGRIPSFSKRYGTKMLVYYEWHDRMDRAIARETILKNWKRQWKLDLIEKFNPEWEDLYPLLFE